MVSVPGEVLPLAAHGPGNQRVAGGRHLSNAHEKLGGHSGGEAVCEAVSEGWISSWGISRTID